MGHKAILNDLRDISQAYSRVGFPNDGLRILARLIAHDLLAKRRDNRTVTNNRKGSAPQILEDRR